MPNLHIRAATIGPSSYNKDARSVEVYFASSTPVSRRDARGVYNEVLSMPGADLSRLSTGPVLDAHSTAGGTRATIGKIENPRIEGERAAATIVLSARAELEPFCRDVEDGIHKNISVGFSVERWAEDKAPDGTRTRTAVRWTPKEISFCSIPADHTATTRSKDIMPENISDRPIINRQIRELGNRSGVSAAILDGLIDGEATIELARETILNDIIVRAPKINSAAARQSTTDDPEFFRDTVADALLVRTNPLHKPSEAARQYIGLPLAEIARACLTRDGVNTTGMGADTLITRALSPYTSSDFPALMLNVFGKTLRTAYSAAPSGLKPICKQSSAVDFRPKVSVMLDSTALSLEEVLESGEYKHGGLVDGSESYSVKTFGKIINCSRKLLVNDDLNALSDLFARFGIAAAQFEATNLANLLISNPLTNEDGLPIFHVNHGNIAAIAGPPSVDTLSAARLAMRHQYGRGGGLIAVSPKYLIVSAEGETDAEKLIAEITPTKTSDVNPFSELAGLLVEPRLPPSGWYMAASPDQLVGLEFSYLSSLPGPQLESRLGFEVDGMQTRVRLDFGSGILDFRGLYFNPGI